MSRAARLGRALAARGVQWPASVAWHAAAGSTNDLLKDQARAGAPEWTAVLADTQTSGRGRGGRPWVSPSGGLYLSVLLRPDFDQVALLPLAAGLAVAEMTLEHGVESELKWPNDVQVHGRKLAGILSESSSSSSRVDWVVVGIGVNVSVEAKSLGPLAENATSLHLESEAAPEVEEVAAGVLDRLSVWYDALGSRPRSVVEAWRARAVRWWGRAVQVQTRQGVLRGTLRDVDETGALLLDVEGGGAHKVVSGEVTQLRPAAPTGRDT